MNSEEYKDLLEIRDGWFTHVHVDDLDDKTDRTLIFGNEGEETFHLYLENGIFFRRIRHPDRRGCSSELRTTVIAVGDCAPKMTGGIIPQESDYKFCLLLKRMGLNMNICLGSME